MQRRDRQPLPATCALAAALIASIVCAAPQQNMPGRISLSLPRTVYAVPGVAMSLYFDNVVLVINPANYSFEVTCPKGSQDAERWTWTPKPADVGDYPLSLSVRDKAGKLIARSATTVHVSPADAGAGKPVTILIIGDSLTRGSVYQRRLLNLCKKPGNPKITLIGTRGPKNQPDNRHEGCSGWTAHRFANYFRGGVKHTGHRGKDGSPFVYKGPDGKPQIDFGAYCRDVNKGKAPDFITIMLGINDTFSSTDANIKNRADNMLKQYDRLVKAFHSVDRNTKIGVLLVTPPAGTQDAVGKNYGCRTTRWQVKRNMHTLAQAMIRLYGGRRKENIFIVPVNVNLDCLRGYPRRMMPFNARTKKKGWRLRNGVHPAVPGHGQIGDSIYCWIKAELSK